MASPLERQFQDDVITALQERGWTTGTADCYDAQRALYPEDVINFYQCAYPEEWQKFVERFPDNPKTALLDEVVKHRRKRGTLQVLRKEQKSLGSPIRLAAFKPD